MVKEACVGSTNQPSDVAAVQERPTRSADDYINAANAVIDIVDIAVGLIPGGGAAVKVAAKAVKYAKLARPALEKLPEAAPLVQKAAGALHDKVPDIVGESASKAAKAVRGAAGAVGERGGAVVASVRDAADARAQEKARREARRALLDGAGIRMSVSQFIENCKTQEKLDPIGGYLAYCGCYAMATYSGAIKKDDYSSFRDIFIGKSKNMGESILADITGRGNVDVYADIKYKQHVYVLLYPCALENLDELESSLITALDADRSYNAEKAMPTYANR